MQEGEGFGVGDASVQDPGDVMLVRSGTQEFCSSVFGRTIPISREVNRSDSRDCGLPVVQRGLPVLLHFPAKSISD